MTDRPILFSAPMVRALLSGEKTQTRRVVKGMPERTLEHDERWFANAMRPCERLPKWSWWDGPPHGQSIYHTAACPYGVPGDRLWVRETWRPVASALQWDIDIKYHADGCRRTIKDDDFPDVDWTCPKAAATGNVSPLFMPRWASRLTLKITEVRVERLQDISEADAEAEGSREPSLLPIIGACWSERDAYAKLWESINGKGSWASSPWVWALTFEVEQ